MQILAATVVKMCTKCLFCVPYVDCWLHRNCLLCTKVVVCFVGTYMYMLFVDRMIICVMEVVVLYRFDG